MSCDPNLEKNKYEQAEGRAETRNKENQPNISYIRGKFRSSVILDI